LKLRPPITARYADFSPQFPEQERTNAQQAGLKYERDVLRQMGLLYKNVKPSPWLLYKASNTSGICQPDALWFLTPKHICIVEIKLTWVRNARDKLLNFYGPVVEAAHKNCKVSYLQIYKNTKPASHKRKLNFFELETLKPGIYKECHYIP